MKSLTYAITGANGQIGAFLVEYLRNCGHTVYELVRSPEKAVDKNYYQFFDLSQPLQMPSLHGVDVLVHGAYYFDATNKDYEKMNKVGTQILFQQAKDDHVKYSIFISTLSAHARSQSLYGRIKYQLEQSIMADHENSVIVRPGLVFHQPLKGITAAMDNFVKKFPVVPLIGNGKQLIYPCLLEELVQLISLLSINQPAIKKPIIAASEHAITFKQLVRYLAKQRQKKVLLFPIPFYGIYGLLKLVEFFKLPLGLRSDSLLGLQYGSEEVDFSVTDSLGAHFSPLKI